MPKRACKSGAVAPPAALRVIHKKPVNCGHAMSGSRWTPQEDGLLAWAVSDCTDASGSVASWREVQNTLEVEGFNRTIAMCRNRWQRINADKTSAKFSCAICGTFPARGHTCTGVPDVASPLGTERVEITKQIVHMRRHTPHDVVEYIVSNTRAAPLEVRVAGAVGAR